MTPRNALSRSTKSQVGFEQCVTIGVSGEIPVRLRRKDAIGTITRIDALQPEKAREQQAGPYQQHRQRNLRRNQCVPQAAMLWTLAGTRGPLLQGLHEIDTRRGGRKRSEDHARGHRSRQRERKHPRINSDLAGALGEATNESRKQINRQRGKQQADDAAEDRQQHALGEQLSNQLRPRRAHCASHRELAFAPEESCKRKIGHVRTRQ